MTKLRRRKLRGLCDPSRIHHKNKTDASHMKRKRGKESEEEVRQQKARNAANMQRRRDNETKEQALQRQAVIAANIQRKRDNETIEETNQRRAKHNETMNGKRRDQCSSTNRTGSPKNEDDVNILNLHGVPCLSKQVKIKEPLRKAQALIRRTTIADDNTNDLHQALVCVICDELIIGTEQACDLDAAQILKHRDRLSIDSYNEFFGVALDPVLVKQYEIQGLHGLLLSPRSPCTGDKYKACAYCYSGMRDCNLGSNNPPKYSIANGFAIGTVPLRSILSTCGFDCSGFDDIELEVEYLTPILCAAIAPVRPYAYIFAYTGGRHTSIRGNFQFFDADQSKLAQKLSEKSSNIYIVLVGSMTPSQKKIVRMKKEFLREFYFALLKWFKDHHPGFSNVELECPEINLVEDPESIHNTDEEGNPDIENQIDGADYFFTSGEEPTKDTSVYKTSRQLALALLEQKAAPTLVVQGGRFATHTEVAHVENVCPIQFPFGSGGPTLKRPVDISDEEILRHYLRLSLRQFMKSDFVLLANHMLNRLLSYKTAVVKCRPIIDNIGTTMGEEIAKMTVEDIKKAVEEEEKWEKHKTGNELQDQTPKQQTTASKFLRAVQTSCRAMGHTKEAAEYARRKCFALQDFFGMHSLFFTITPDDECGFRVSLYANSGTGVSNTQYLLH